MDKVVNELGLLLNPNDRDLFAVSSVQSAWWCLFVPLYMVRPPRFLPWKLVAVASFPRRMCSSSRILLLLHFFWQPLVHNIDGRCVLVLLTPLERMSSV